MSSTLLIFSVPEAGSLAISPAYPYATPMLIKSLCLHCCLPQPSDQSRGRPYRRSGSLRVFKEPYFFKSPDPSGSSLIFRSLLDLYELLQISNVLQRPKPVDDLPYDLFLCNTSDCCITRVNRYASVVSHDKDLGLRHLVRKLDVALSKCLLIQIRLINQISINIYVAVLIDIYPVTCLARLS